MNRPSHEDIIKFIDSKEVLTVGELSMFLVGRKKLPQRKWIDQYVEYIYQTKKWEDLDNYRNFKIVYSTPEQQERFLTVREIYHKDKRLQECGSRKAVALLKDVYGIHIPRGSYLNAVKNFNKINYTFRKLKHTQ